MCTSYYNTEDISTYVVTTDYKFNNCVIQQNKSTKYLGVTITNKLSWPEHITNISNKANSIRALL